MPAGKYHCDYCDKEFKDTPAARKRHLQGIFHQRNRTLWYDSFHRDASHFPSSAHGTAQGVCNRFVNTGAGPYGDSCKYIHPKQNTNVPNLNTQGAPIGGNMDGQSLGMSLGNLPPSLRPPPEGRYPPLPFVDWG